MLAVNNLIGFGAASSVVASPSLLSFVTDLDDSSNLTTYTFSSASIGTASADRLVIVTVHWYENSARTLNSATIDGGAATIVVQGDGSGVGSAIIQRAVASGTTADISFTMSGSCFSAGIGIWTKTGGASNTANDTDSDSGSGVSTLSVSVDVLADGVALGAATTGNGAASYTGVTERFDSQIGDVSGANFSGGDYSTVSEGLAHSISYTSGAGRAGLVGAAWA